MNLPAKLERARAILADPRWWVFFVQRRFGHPATRRRHAARVAARRPAPLHLGHADAAGAVALDKQGIFHLGELLPPAAVAEARDFLGARAVQDDYRPHTAPFLPSGEGRPDGCHVAFHSPEDVIAAPHLLALANRPEILGLAEAFLGARPLISYMAAWWSYPTGLGPQQAEHFHRDVDDWRFVKLFVYLTDVGPENGPHIYAAGSANRAELLPIRRYSDDEVVAAMGVDALVTNTAPAGHGFLEDTFGLHKGQPVRQGARLIFQAVYGLTALPYGPRGPVAALAGAPEGCDAYTNGVYLT